MDNHNIYLSHAEIIGTKDHVFKKSKPDDQNLLGIIQSNREYIEYLPPPSTKIMYIVIFFEKCFLKSDVKFNIFEAYEKKLRTTSLKRFNGGKSYSFELSKRFKSTRNG